jgi:ADP-heptose:LPS heptosyltransferase
MTDISLLRRNETGLGAAIRWHINDWLTRRPWLLNMLGARMTVFDVFGAPGDTLLTGIVCRYLHECYPRIRINCLTPNPDLLELDPNISALNEPESYICLWHSYLGLIAAKDIRTNILCPTLSHIGIKKYEYRGKVYLSDEELSYARGFLRKCEYPILAFSTKSKEPVKNWPLDYWIKLLDRIRDRFTLVHLGDQYEPHIPDAIRFAGSRTKRESMAILACATLYVGPDSFLMHAANGLGVRSVIIFGGARTPENCGYKQNINLFTKITCGPCWIHTSENEKCGFNFECLKRTPVSRVYDAVSELWNEIAQSNVGMNN